LKIQALALEPAIVNDYHPFVILPSNPIGKPASPGRGPLAKIRGIIRKPATGGDKAPLGLPNGARVVLAPLCGITDAVFRKLCLDQGVEMVVTEMVSSDALSRGKTERVRSLRGLDTSRGPLSIQIFGADPERMGETAAMLSELGPEYVDMNFGCPVRKIVTRNGGSAVLRDLDLLGRICREVVRRSSVPVSAKIRAGWDKSSGTGIREIVRTIEDAGVSMLAVHARTRKQGFKGKANWDLIAEAKAAVSIPVIGNGDVNNADDFFSMVCHTGCDAVMIGRGAIGNPWIFSQIQARLGERPGTSPSNADRVEMLIEHVRRKVDLEGEPGGVITTRKVMASYLRELPGARELRGRLMAEDRLEGVENVLQSWLETNCS
jgi:tRNA-dihydrouridine synthase B